MGGILAITKVCGPSIINPPHQYESLTYLKKKVVLAIPNPILFLIYLPHFPQFQVYLVLQQAFIKHLLYATNLIIGKGIFPIRNQFHLRGTESPC